MLRSDLLIALDVIMELDYDDPLGIDMDQATGDVGSFIVPPFKCEVALAGATVTEVCAGSTSTPVVKFDTRPTAGSDASRGDGDIAELNLLTAAAGAVIVDKVGLGEILEPGEEVIIQLVTAAVGTPTGHIKPFLLVKQLPETLANLSNVSETT
jgi:hypothetical protein